MLVMIIEDNDDLRELMMDVIKHEGYDVVGARHGQDALERLARLEDDPSLVLLDLMMPVMDGMTFLDRARAASLLPGVPIVVLTALPREVHPQGVKQVVKKPVSPRALLEIVRDLCPAAPS